MNSEKHSQIFDASKIALSKSTKIKDWLDENFPDSALHLYKGVLPEMQPDSGKYPIVAFSSIERAEKGDNIREEQYICSVSVAIKDRRETEDPDEDETFFDKETIEGTATTPEIKVYTLPGLEKVEQFWDLVTNEILGIKSLYSKISVAGDALLEEAFPIFKFSGSFSFALKKEMRSGTRL